jgi:hypothetical protein
MYRYSLCRRTRTLELFEAVERSRAYMSCCQTCLLKQEQMKPLTIRRQRSLKLQLSLCNSYPSPGHFDSPAAATSLIASCSALAVVVSESPSDLLRAALRTHHIRIRLHLRVHARSRDPDGGKAAHKHSRHHGPSLLDYISPLSDPFCVSQQRTRTKWETVWTTVKRDLDRHLMLAFRSEDSKPSAHASDVASPMKVKNGRTLWLWLSRRSTSLPPPSRYYIIDVNACRSSLLTGAGANSGIRNASDG